MSPRRDRTASNPATTEAKPESREDVLLEISGLCVDYGLGHDPVHAVADVDLVLRRGEVLGLAGESGSGKSTLAYAVTRLLREPGVITAGTVSFNAKNGERVDMLAADAETMRGLRWSEIAVVFQSAMHALNPVMTVGAQLRDVLKAHRPDMTKAQRHERAAHLLHMVGITPDRLLSYPHELSGGMRQRVMIGMALALEPQVLIMDEPTTALDVVTQREILEELIRLRDRLGFAVLFITHDLSLLIELADSIAVMYAGRLVERAPAGALFQAPRHPYTYGLLNSFPALHGERRRMTGITGSPPDLRQVPSGCAFHPRCSFALSRCSIDTPRLVPLGSAPPHGAPAGTAREAACWLQHEATRPEELSRPELTTVGRRITGRPPSGAGLASQDTTTPGGLAVETTGSES